MANRYFTSLIQGNNAFIEGEDAFHLAKVLRAKPGEEIILCDGKQTDYVACIKKVSTKEIELDILSSTPNSNEPSIDVFVFIGYAKGSNRMQYAIQKSIELGAKEITPFISDFCMVKPKNEIEKTKRFQRIATEAAKQSGRGIIPLVKPSVCFEDMLQQANDSKKSLFFYEKGGQSLKQVIENETKFAIITGPEGGFSSQEVGKAKENGCIQMGLGPRILRCETAPVVALASLMTLTENV